MQSCRTGPAAILTALEAGGMQHHRHAGAERDPAEFNLQLPTPHIERSVPQAAILPKCDVGGVPRWFRYRTRRARAWPADAGYPGDLGASPEPTGTLQVTEAIEFGELAKTST